MTNGTDPPEAVIQAALDLIAMGQGPSDPVALADKVSMVSQMPDVQMNATLPDVLTLPHVQKGLQILCTELSHQIIVLAP